MAKNCSIQLASVVLWLIVTVYAGGVGFVLYPQDHVPRYAHAFCGDAQIIVELRNNRIVALAQRRDAVRENAKMGDIKNVLIAAARNYDLLVDAWEQMHNE